jgi:uncharacterized membrane protein
MVDVAARALSPAVNDPTTAVQVLDHLEDVLRLIGTTELVALSGEHDAPRKQGVVIAVRRWEDYLTLALTEIRQYGESSVQVMRRLRALLEELHGAVRPEHVPAVEAELRRLDATVEGYWGRSVDLERASTADRQGIGGPGASGSPG